jgi:ATP-dependent DNA ligase
MIKRRVPPAGFIEPCIPVPASKLPAGTGWVNEIKHDGYRLMVRRDGTTVRLFTRRGYDWTERFPVIAAAAAEFRARTFTLDGEAVVCGADGIDRGGGRDDVRASAATAGLVRVPPWSGRVGV